MRIAVQAELDRVAEATPLQGHFATLRRLHPLPPPTREIADKALFDEFSGES